MVLANGAAFVLAVGVPIFAYLVSIAASLFASWYTYGIAGAFWLHDAYNGLDKGRVAGVYGVRAWTGSPVKTAVNVATFLAGGFICIAGECFFFFPFSNSFLFPCPVFFFPFRIPECPNQNGYQSRET